MQYQFISGVLTFWEAWRAAPDMVSKILLLFMTSGIENTSQRHTCYSYMDNHRFSVLHVLCHWCQQPLIDLSLCYWLPFHSMLEWTHAPLDRKRTEGSEEWNDPQCYTVLPHFHHRQQLFAMHTQICTTRFVASALLLAGAVLSSSRSILLHVPLHSLIVWFFLPVLPEFCGPRECRLFAKPRVKNAYLGKLPSNCFL